MTINHITVYLALIASLPICFAYLRIARSASEIVRHMSVSIFCIVSSYALRGLFWDASPVWLGDDWRVVYVAIGGPAVNGIWNLSFAYGCWRALKALHLMVPERERIDWPWWRAWLYPPWRRRRVTRRE